MAALVSPTSLLSPGAGGAAPAGGAGTSLPWDAARGGANMDFTGNPASLSNAYASNYNAALSFNQQNYNNIIGGYQQALANQAQAQGGIQGGYGDLTSQLAAQQGAVTQGYGQLGQTVQGLIQGVDQSQRQAIADAYAQQSGALTSSLVGRGLGNTTILDSMQQGLGLQRNKADIALSNQMAQLQAGYASSIGLSGLAQQQAAAQNLAGYNQAGLNYAQQALSDRTQLALNQLGFQNSVNAPYPNQQLYAQMAQQYGAAQQSGADRAQLADQFNRLLAAGQQQAAVPGAGGAGAGYQPAGGGFSPPTPNFGGAGGSFGAGGGYGASSLGTQSPFMAGTPGGFGGGAYASAQDVNDYLDSFGGGSAYASAQDVNDYLDSFGGGGGYGNSPFGAMALSAGLSQALGAGGYPGGGATVPLASPDTYGGDF